MLCALNGYEQVERVIQIDLQGLIILVPEISQFIPQDVLIKR